MNNFFWKKRQFLKPDKIKIGFVVGGAQKAGTTSLNYYLNQHPEIGMPNVKELHYFDNDELFSRPENNHKAINQYFDPKPEIKIYGETTPIYLFWEPSIQRIWNYNKEMKLIFILRNPATRAFSNWNMEFNRKNEHEDFLYCIKHEQDRIENGLNNARRIYSYVARGLYAEQIKRAQKFFPSEQVMFIKYEDYMKNQEETVRQVFDFLGVDPEKFQYQFELIHQSNYFRSMTTDEKLHLAELFYSDINEVEKLLGWNCADWKK
ncbi:MAG: sulfotransferase [Bacteroidales bacterium]|nr:sulfotransferase [Bacteroidales bacterium]MCF8406058.1 sulfotransferase [Bacteroidales bacterium]